MSDNRPFSSKWFENRVLTTSVILSLAAAASIGMVVLDNKMHPELNKISATCQTEATKQHLLGKDLVAYMKTCVSKQEQNTTGGK